MNASVLSRLAVALLVAMGFVVPTEAPRRDEVAQGVARPERVVVEVREVVAPKFTSVPVTEVVELQSRTPFATRLFLQHAALII